ncbi:MAG: SpoIIE family protein phosphatase [Helcococcus sp.]|nr:SpoIIE family protein phosphatase [Helcococcus sp.]
MPDKLRIENFTRLTEGINFRFLDSMDDLVRIRDGNGEILFENKSMRNIVSEMIKDDKKIVRSAEMFFELYRGDIKSKITMEREVQIFDKLYAVKASPIFDNEQIVEGYIEVYRDITLERSITKQLYNANRKIHNDILLAKNIQKSILPRIEKFQSLEFEWSHIASGDLSGDLFDIVEIDKNRVGIYIADVVGHGISASIMTMFIRQSMRQILQKDYKLNPKDAIFALKQMFKQLDLDINQYFSILYMLIDLSDDSLSYVNAGHNCMPILFNDKNIAIMHNKGKLISNLFENVSYNQKKIKVNDDDKILLYTDGITDTQNYKGQYFDESRLVKWIQKNRNEDKIVTKLIKDLEIFRNLIQKDDIAILLIKKKGI